MSHDAHELCKFFSAAGYDLKEKVLLELCSQDPDLMLKIIRMVDDGGAIEEAKTLMRAGQKIQAIKRYREMTGCGLQESKNFVESMPLS